MKIDTKVNNIPSLTWNWLKLNYAELKIDSEYKEKTNISTSRIPDGATYEKDSEKILMSVPPVETGMGKSVSTILYENNILPCSLIVNDEQKIEKPFYMHFDCKDKCASLSSQIIIAKKNAEITVIMDFTSDSLAEGIQIVQTKLYANKNAKIHLITVQLLGKNYIHLNDIGALCEKNANIKITQIELGSKQSFVGVHSLLKEYQSSFNSDTAYFCKGNQEFDFNYVVTQTGKKTDSKMNIAGTLKDNAKKTYRGTIDFKNGCQGASGNEQEETLLLTPTVVNKSIPVILCDEEDVAGEHGATIGKLSNDILFYMNAHGISKEAAEKIMCLAKINNVAAAVPDENLKEKISQYVEEAFYE